MSFSAIHGEQKYPIISRSYGNRIVIKKFLCLEDEEWKKSQVNWLGQPRYVEEPNKLISDMDRWCKDNCQAEWLRGAAMDPRTLKAYFTYYMDEKSDRALFLYEWQDSIYEYINETSQLKYFLAQTPKLASDFVVLDPRIHDHTVVYLKFFDMTWDLYRHYIKAANDWCEGSVTDYPGYKFTVDLEPGNDYMPIHMFQIPDDVERALFKLQWSGFLYESIPRTLS